MNHCIIRGRVIFYHPNEASVQFDNVYATVAEIESLYFMHFTGISKCKSWLAFLYVFKRVYLCVCSKGCGLFGMLQKCIVFTLLNACIHIQCLIANSW